LEALRILANLLVLHAAGRTKFANAGGARIIARALARKNTETPTASTGESVDLLFLLGRIGFLVTADRKDAVAIMVDKEGVVDSLLLVSLEMCLD
jgi:hypothetical protein